MAGNNEGLKKQGQKGKGNSKGINPKKESMEAKKASIGEKKAPLEAKKASIGEKKTPMEAKKASMGEKKAPIGAKKAPIKAKKSGKTILSGANKNDNVASTAINTAKEQAGNIKNTASAALNEQKAVLASDASAGDKAAYTALNAVDTGVQMYQEITGFVGGITQKISENVAMPLLNHFADMQGKACYPVCKQLDIVLGIDLHFVNMPFAPGVPIPMPHPYIGVLLNPRDFVSVIATSVLSQFVPAPAPSVAEGASVGDAITGKMQNMAFTAVSMAVSSFLSGATVKLGDFLPRVVAGTDTISIPHFPIGTGFYPAFDNFVSKNNGHAFMGSLLTTADMKPLSGGAPHLHNDCWDIGIPSIPQMWDEIESIGAMAKQGKGTAKDGISNFKAKGDAKPQEQDDDNALFDKRGRFKLYVPTGFIISLPITKGQVLTNPVPTPINPLTIVDKLLQMGLAKLKGIIKGKIENLICKLENTKIGKKLGCKFWTPVSKVFGTGESHPVDVATGHFYTDNKDFVMGGVIPIVWERTYYSYSDYAGSFGLGWHFEYDMALAVDDDVPNMVGVRMKDGRPTPFVIPKKGESFFNRKEKLWLHRDEDDTFWVSDKKGLQYVFAKKTTYNKFNDTEAFLLACIRDENGFEIKIERDRNGIIKKIIDTASRTLKFDNDGNGHITAIWAPDPNWNNIEPVCISRYTYDEQGRLTSQIDARGNSMLFEYEGGLMTKETWRNGLAWRVNYNGTDNNAKVVEISGDNNLFHYKFTYPAADCTIVEKSLGDKTVYYHRKGLVTKRIDPNGGEHSFRYSPDIDLEWETDAVGNTTCYTHDEWGNVLTRTAPDNGFVKLEYNDFNHPWLPTDAVSEVGGKFGWKYDAHGNLREETNAAGMKTKYKYANGLLVSIEDGESKTLLKYDRYNELEQAVASDGGTTTWRSDVWGRCIKYTNPKNAISEYSYDLNNNVTRIIEADGNTRLLTYDAENNLTQAQDNDRTVTFTYTGVNKLASRTENGAGIKFIYDTEDRLRSVVNEHGERYNFDLDAMGKVTVETGFDGITRTYTRDIAGKILSVTVGKNKTTNYTYDACGRVTGITRPDGSTETYTYRRDGAIMQADNANAKVTFERDQLGRVLKEISNGVEVASTYNMQGQREKIISTLGADITAAYNPLGDLLTLSSGEWSTQYRRDLFGLETDRNLGNGISVSTERDRLGRVTDRKTKQGFLYLDQKEYFWSTNNKLSSIVDNGKHTFFEYDKWGNLAKTTRHEDKQVEYRTPDKMGNLYETEDRSDRRYARGGQLQCTQDWTFKYNDEGFLIEKRHRKHVQQAWLYKWNGAGMLEQVTRPDGVQIRYWYDALGRRIQKRVGTAKTTKYLWDGNVILHEQTNNEPVVTWIFEEGTFTPTGKIVGEENYQIVCDYMGTPTDAYDANGKHTWSCELNSYGKVRNEWGTKNLVPFRYQGQYEDSDTGLSYNRFRYYDSTIGNYISQDPIRLAGCNPTLYGYVHDTNSWVDVLGLAGTCEDEIKDLPEFSKMTKAQIEQEVSKRGYTKIKDNASGTTYVKQTNDGQYAVVRIDPANPRSAGTQKADAVAHAHKETAGGYTNTETDRPSTQRYDDKGHKVGRDDFYKYHIPVKTN